MTSGPLRRLPLEVAVISTGTEALEAAEREDPVLAILDAELPELSGYEATRRLKQVAPGCKVVLVLGRRLSAERMRKVTESRCDEVLVAPMSADELYDVVAFQLGLARRGSERFDLDLAVLTDDGQRSVDGRVTNLSLDGARLLLPEPMGEGTRLRLRITPDEVEAEPLDIQARIIWSQSREEEATVAGAAFEEVSEDNRRRLSRLIHFDLVEETQRPRIVIKGDLTEASSFDDLVPALVGRVDFDLSQLRYINSLGAVRWVDFLSRIRVRGYEFHACSIPFVLQASMVPEVLGQGTVASFFAPYRCRRCDHQEERLLQSAAVLAADDLEPPAFSCPRCEGVFALDDDPARFLAFLRPESAE
jgi:CheY-like chemotaxis protein